jgi:hypothetical protein
LVRFVGDQPVPPYPKRRFLTYIDDTRPADGRLHATAQITRHPIHPMLVPFPIVCFVGALATDIAYAITEEMMWADF